MHKFDLISYMNRGYRALRSTLYTLLIFSMLWIPRPMDVSATVSSTENRNSSLICEEGINGTECYNVDAQTVIIIPRQQRTDEIEIIATSLEEMAMMSSSDDEFEATRGIMGLKTINRETGEHITQFEPALRIEATYTRADVRAAGGLQKLTLGYFNGEFMQAFSHIEIQGNWRQGTISAEIRELAAAHQPMAWLENTCSQLIKQFLSSWYQHCDRCNSQIYMGGGND